MAVAMQITITQFMVLLCSVQEYNHSSIQLTRQGRVGVTVNNSGSTWSSLRLFIVKAHQQKRACFGLLEKSPEQTVFSANKS
jgi:hypothetical protein